MKKTILLSLAALLAALTLIAVLSACGKVTDSAYPKKTTPSRSVTEAVYSSNTETLPEADDPTESESGTEPAAENKLGKTVAFEGGLSVTLGGEARTELEKCGEALSVTEAPSCIYDGVDRVCAYDGYTVTTSSDSEGNDTVSSVEIVSSDASLAGGVTAGSDIADVISVYGDDYTESFGLYTFEGDGVTLTVASDGGTVTSIAFSVKQ